MTDHRVPFQCSTSVSNLPRDPCWTPTAQTSDVESADAAKRMSRADPGWGLPEMVQRWPSHASMRPRSSKLSLRRTPTAHAWPLAAATPKRVLKLGPASGVGTADQVLPSKCAASDRVASWLPLAVSGRKLPTAQTSSGADAATAPRLLSFVPRSGLGSTFQPAALGVRVVVVDGSAGVGVGVGRFGTVSGLVAMGVDPVTAKSGASGVTFVASHVNSRQPSPKDRWMVWSNEKWL